MEVMERAVSTYKYNINNVYQRYAIPIMYETSMYE